MRRPSWLAAVAALLATLAAAAPAVAAPAIQLQSAAIAVTPRGAGVTDVREDVVLAGVPAGANVDQVMPVFSGVTVAPLVLTVAGTAVAAAATPAGSLTRLRFAAPSAGELRYTVTYTVRDAAGSGRIPLVVPAYGPAGGDAVQLTYVVPPGQYLQGDSFPVVFGQQGRLQRQLSAVPLFLHFAYAPTPPSVWTPYNLITALVVAVIAALTLAWIASERRVQAGGESGV